MWNDEARKERRVVWVHEHVVCEGRSSGGWGCVHAPGEGGAALMGWGARAGGRGSGEARASSGVRAPRPDGTTRVTGRGRQSVGCTLEHTLQHVSPRRGEPRRAWWEAAVDVGRGGEVQDCVRSCSPKEPPGAGRRSARERGEATVCHFTHTEEVRSSVTRGHERIERSRVTRQRLDVFVHLFFVL